MFQQEVKFYNVYSTFQKYALKQLSQKKNTKLKNLQIGLVVFFWKNDKKLFKKIELIWIRTGQIWIKTDVKIETDSWKLINKKNIDILNNNVKFPPLRLSPC